MCAPYVCRLTVSLLSPGANGFKRVPGGRSARGRRLCAVYVPGPRAMEGTNPVNKKLAAALSGGAVLVLALSGCGGSNNNDKLNSWAKQVCDAVQPQAKKIEAANAAIQKETSDNSTPEQVQKTDAQAFQDMSDAYKAIGAAVQNAGAPDVDNG